MFNLKTKQEKSQRKSFHQHEAKKSEVKKPNVESNITPKNTNFTKDKESYN